VTSAGVDLGGTWLRVCAVDGRRRVLFKVKQPAPPPEKLGSALAGIFRKKNFRPDRLVVGSKGVWKPAPRKAMAARLKGLAGAVVVMSDVELAYRSVLGERPGVLLLAGTGSIALARDRQGRWHRAGGLGPQKGDEGSGFWIGKEYLARTSGRKPSMTPAGVRRTAALAGKAFSQPRWRPLIREAAVHLARMAQEAARRAKLSSPAVGWWGRLMEEASFRREVFRLLPSARAVTPRADAATRAATWPPSES
jgi:hypothetical protein